MSRIGRRPVQIPDGVTVSIETSHVTVKGPKGELQLELHPKVSVAQEENMLQVTPTSTDKAARALQGLTARLLANLLVGVSEGFSRALELQGVGYRAALQGKTLVLNVGYSHPVNIEAPEGIELQVQKNVITVSGIDRQRVGQVAAEIRRVRPPEPYKGKGIRYVGEQVRRKAGKAAKAAGSA